MTTAYNAIPPEIDIAGVIDVDNARSLVDEQNLRGKPISGQSGSVANLIAGAPVGQTRVTGLTGMSATDSEGRFLEVGGSGSGNDGDYLIVSYISATSVDILGSLTVPDTNNGAITWTEREPYALADDINFERTDRRLIKGTAQHYTDVPTYERPSAVGTLVPKNLTNLLSKDAFAEVRNVKFGDILLRPRLAAADGNALVSDETFTTDEMHFVAGDLDSFVTITDGTSTGAAGTYRVKTVTDGQTLELDGFAPTGAGTCSWVLEGDVKGFLTSAGYADAVDRTGVPIADSGAEDETEYDATFADVVDPITKAGLSTEASLSIFGRAFGDDADPNNTATNEGTRAFIQLYTGDNDGTATVSLLEVISGKSGSLASVVNATTQLTGLTGAETQASQANAGTFSLNGDIVTLNETAAFSAALAGDIVRIASATSGGNNGDFLVLTADNDNITYRNAAGVAEAGAGTTQFFARVITEADVGRYITVYATAVDGNQRHALITAFDGEGAITTNGANYATDGNDGAILWQFSRHPGTVCFFTPLRQREDQLSETARRTTLIGGIVSDAELSLDIAQIREFIGAADGDTTPGLSNTGNFFPFSDIPNPADTDLEEVVNILNQEVGNRDYSGTAIANVTGLADGQTITASIEALALAIGAASITRVIERLSAQVAKNVAHSLPSGTYTPDSNSGQNMWVFWSRQLRDPGDDVSEGEYEETSGTAITPYMNIPANNSINYFILQ